MLNIKVESYDWMHQDDVLLIGPHNAVLIRNGQTFEMTHEQAKEFDKGYPLPKDFHEISERR